MKVLIFCAFCLKTPIHVPKIEFWGVWPLNGQRYQRHPKGTSLWGNTSYDVDYKIVKTGPLVAQLTLLHNVQNPMLYNAFQLARHPKGAPSHAASTRHLVHGSLGPRESTSRMASRSVQPLLHGSRLWPTDRQRLTDHATPVHSNRPHLANAAIQPNNSNITTIIITITTSSDKKWHTRRLSFLKKSKQRETHTPFSRASTHCSTIGLHYTVSQKKGATLTVTITLSILGGFAKFFHCCKEQ